MNNNFQKKKRCKYLKRNSKGVSSKTKIIKAGYEYATKVIHKSNIQILICHSFI